MIIVVTHDPRMREFYGGYISDQRPNYQYWQRATVLDADQDQQAANAQLATLLRQLRPGEPVCLVGHGNDYGTGDPPSTPTAWWWDFRTLGQLFLDCLPHGDLGPVLFESCGDSVANLPPRVALELDGSRLVGMWQFGHQYPAGIVDALPSEVQVGGPYYLGARVT
jgi:hypothetical protein